VYCFIFQAPQRFKGAAQLFRCDLCRKHFESVQGAKGHTNEKKHKEKKNVRSVCVCVCCIHSCGIKYLKLSNTFIFDTTSYLKVVVFGLYSLKYYARCLYLFQKHVKIFTCIVRMLHVTYS